MGKARFALDNTPRFVNKVFEPRLLISYWNDRK